MFHVAFSRGRGPAYADLPPTLQPHAILDSAPHADRARVTLFSGLTYLLLAGGAFAFATLGPKSVVNVFRPTKPERVVEFDPPTQRPPVERVETSRATTGGPSRPEATVVPAVVASDPQVPATGLPTQDRSGDVVPKGPAGPLGPALNPGPAAPASTGGATVHDFTSVGLAVRHQVAPAYPDMARIARIQGAVVLLMTVDEGGQPVQIQVLEGHAVFHAPALAAARQWRFEPALLDGRPVKASFKLTLKFSLR